MNSVQWKLYRISSLDHFRVHYETSAQADQETNISIRSHLSLPHHEACVRSYLQALESHTIRKGSSSLLADGEYVTMVKLRGMHSLPTGYINRGSYLVLKE